MIFVEVMGFYNDEDIYFFDNIYFDGVDYIYKYGGYRNNVIGQKLFSYRNLI